MKFAQLQAIATPSRKIDSIVDGTIKYDNLSVPVKIVTLQGNVKGAVTLDRFEDFKNAITEDADGDAVLPASWKVGKDKAGIGFGYWYDSNTLSGTAKGELVVG